MKAIFTILFFADTVLLVSLTYSFLRMLDGGIRGWPLLGLLTGIIGSIILLAFFLYRYIKLPPPKS